MDSNYTRISPTELKAWMDENRSFTLVDVVSEEAFACRRLPGAINACVYETVWPERLAQAGVKPEDVVVVYGVNNDTRDADAAATKLMRLGFRRVYLLSGGLEGWQAAGLPLEGSGDTPPDHSPVPPDGTYRVDTAESVIEWTGRNAMGKHTGTLRLADGFMRLQKGQVGGEFVVDLASMANTDLEDPTLADMLLAHLMSYDFLDAERHPEVRFDILQAEALPGATPGAVNCHLRGELLMRGRIEPLAFPATLSVLENGVAAEAHFDLDRTRWGAIYGSGKFFKHLGKHLVNDAVSIALRVVARQ